MWVLGTEPRQEKHKYLSAESFFQLGGAMVPVCFAKKSMLSAQARLSHAPSQEARTSITGNPGDISSSGMDLKKRWEQEELKDEVQDNLECEHRVDQRLPGKTDPGLSFSLLSRRLTTLHSGISLLTTPRISRQTRATSSTLGSFPID